uniref:Uncharacterized protein n=1 Tax=Rhizophora mucronata TaxID=61149 RepID=A0A2P2PQV2_RHIMU
MATLLLKQIWELFVLLLLFL